MRHPVLRRQQLLVLAALLAIPACRVTGLTLWESLYVEPEVVPSATGPMLQTAGIILVIELIVIGLVRRRVNSKARNDLGTAEPLRGSHV